MYKVKAAEIVTKANRVEIGLEKLKSGAKDVEKMKIVLAEEEVDPTLLSTAYGIAYPILPCHTIPYHTTYCRMAPYPGCTILSTLPHPG